MVSFSYKIIDWVFALLLGYGCGIFRRFFALPHFLSLFLIIAHSFSKSNKAVLPHDFGAATAFLLRFPSCFRSIFCVRILAKAAAH